MTTILIEDDANWRIKFLKILDELQITVLGVATSVSESVSLLQHTTPDFIVADILLKNERVFEVFTANATYCKIPTILVTSSDKEIDFKNAKNIEKHFYIVKPVHKLTIKSAIANLLPTNNNLASNKEAFFTIKGRFNQKIQLPLSKIVYISQNQHYCTIFTEKQEFVLKKSLGSLIKELDTNFLQVNRSNIININYIENFGVGLETIKVKGIDLPIGLTFKEAVKKLIAENYSLK